MFSGQCPPGKILLRFSLTDDKLICLDPTYDKPTLVQLMCDGRRYQATNFTNADGDYLSIIASNMDNVNSLSPEKMWL